MTNTTLTTIAGVCGGVMVCYICMHVWEYVWVCASSVPADVEARGWYWNVFLNHFFILFLSLSFHERSPFQLHWLAREPPGSTCL